MARAQRRASQSTVQLYYCSLDLTLFQVAVYDYVWEEFESEADTKEAREDEQREVTTHISVHTIYLDG